MQYFVVGRKRISQFGGCGAQRRGLDQVSHQGCVPGQGHILLHPDFYGRQAGVNLWWSLVVGGFGAEVYLSDIGIAVEVQIEMAKNLTKREDVDDEN